MKHRRRTRKNATAMTDIAFLLLLFFLVMAVTGFRTPASVEPPSEQRGGFINERETLHLYITAEGRLLDEAGPLTYQQCAERLSSLTTMASSNSIIITADKKARFENIAPVIELLQQAGIAQVGFAVDIQPEEAV